MTAREITNVVLRLLGLIWVAGAALTMPQFFWLDASTPQSKHLVIGSALSALLWLMFGLVVIVSSRTIADWLVGPGEALSIAATPRELQEIGLSLLGVYFGVGALGRLAGLVYIFARQDAVGVRIESAWAVYPERIVTTAVELLLAIALFLGSHGIANLWARMRSRARDKSGSSAGV